MPGAVAPEETLADCGDDNKDLQILTAAVHRLGPLADLDLVDPPGPNTLAGGAGLQVGVGTGPGHVTVSTK